LGYTNFIIIIIISYHAYIAKSLNVEFSISCHNIRDPAIYLRRGVY